MEVDTDLGIIVVGVAVVADRRRMDRDLTVVANMKVGKRFAEGGSRNLKTDLDRQMFENRKDLEIEVHRTLQNHPL